MAPVEFLSAADAAWLLGVTPGAVRLMHRRGELPLGGRTAGGMHLFNRCDVERLAEKRKSRSDERRSK